MELTNSCEENREGGVRCRGEATVRILLGLGKGCWMRLVVTQLLKKVVEGGKPVELNSKGKAFS